MRIALAFVAACLAAPLAITACGGDSNNNMEAEPFDTLQACYAEHAQMEHLTVQQSIVVCCLDHPIAGVHPSCPGTQTDCVSHVRTNLDASITDADITAACTTYISQK